MSTKYYRNQSMINREADAHIDEDHWLKQFEKNLEKNAVQSKKVDESLFHQINSIMNTKSKYKSVSAAVEDMMQRSGLSDHLKNINKVSNDESLNNKVSTNNQVENKTASINISNEAELEVLKFAKKLKKTIDSAKKLHKSIKNTKDLPLPKVIKEVPSILKTLENYIESTNGNLDVTAILEKIKGIHQKDVSDANDWDDENLLRLISSKKLEKQVNNNQDHGHQHLGRPDTEINTTNDSNTDVFHALMPAKI
jgi:hypothetical protein